MIVIHDLEQGSQAWHDIREGRFTGSSAHNLLKHGAVDYSLTKPSNFKGNFYTKRGHTLEPEAIQLFESIYKTTVQRPGFVTNDRYPTAGYSPDGLTNDMVIEVKCFNEKRHLDMYDGNIPFEILAQIHFGMFVCEKKIATLIIYNPSLDLNKYSVKQQFKMIQIKQNRNIINNFKRILGVTYAV